MSKFRVCLRVATGLAPSSAWIALHRLVEAQARLSGEPFQAIFRRLEEAHGFGRRHPGRWPRLPQIHAAARQLEAERAALLAELRPAEQRRREARRRGLPPPEEPALEAIAGRQRAHRVPRVGCWGWKERREEG